MQPLIILKYVSECGLKWSNVAKKRYTFKNPIEPDLLGQFRIEIIPDNSLSDFGFEHLTVNHTYNYVDPDTWTHKISSQHVERLEMHLCEYLWRGQFEGKDPFIALIESF